MIGTLLKLDRALEGAPDAYVTIGLLIMALLTLVIALGGKPLQKTALLVWLVLP